MTKEGNELIHNYMNIIDIQGKEEWFGDSYDYTIGDNTLVTGLDNNGAYYALDDKTAKGFVSLEEIIEFYNLPVLPENVNTKLEYEQYLKNINLNS